MVLSGQAVAGQEDQTLSQAIEGATPPPTVPLVQFNEINGKKTTFVVMTMCFFNASSGVLELF